MKKIYFDETNHHRKIGVNKEQKLRFDEKTEFFFMFAYIEISNANLKKISILEDKFKKKRKIPEEIEVKSKHLLQKNLYDIDQEQINFLVDVLKIVNSEEKISSIGYVIKLSPFIDYMLFSPEVKKSFQNSNAFVYSFSKYLSIKRLYELNQLLSKNNIMKKIYKNIITWLMEDIEKTHRKDEKNVFKKLIVALKDASRRDNRTWTIEKLNWDYNTIIYSLGEILDEKNEKNIQLTYDSFPELKNMWDQVIQGWTSDLDFKTIDSHSKNNIGLRVVDWFLGLFRKTILSLNKNSIQSRNEYNTTINVNIETVNFMNKNKELFSLLRKVINNDYWSTFANIYCDNFMITCIALSIIKNGDDVSPHNIGPIFLNKINNL